MFVSEFYFEVVCVRWSEMMSSSVFWIFFVIFLEKMFLEFFLCFSLQIIKNKRD